MENVKLLFSKFFPDVVFGKVKSGQEILDALEKEGSQNGKTRVKCFIEDCGEC
jgi:hypothetical protein